MENYLTIPFLLLFVVGYFTTGFLSIFQGRFTRRRKPPLAIEAPVAVEETRAASL